MKNLRTLFIYTFIILGLTHCTLRDYIYPPVSGIVLKDNAPVYNRIAGTEKAAELKKGQAVKIISRSKKAWQPEPNSSEKKIWFKIYFSENQTGWIYSAYIQPALKKANDFSEITLAQSYQIKLNEAIHSGKMTAVKQMIQQGADGCGENYQDYPHIRNPLSQAAFLSQSEIALYILSLNPPSVHIDNALIFASGGTNLKLVELLVQKGANVNSREPGTLRTPLIYSSGVRYNGHPYLEMMQFLVKNGADVNAVDSYGNSALIYAISEKRISAVAFLVKNGANVNLRNKRGETPLLLASESGEAEIKKILTQAGATDWGKRVS